MMIRIYLRESEVVKAGRLLQKKHWKDDGTEILESWLREINLAANLVGEILDLTFEHYPLRELR